MSDLEKMNFNKIRVNRRLGKIEDLITAKQFYTITLFSLKLPLQDSTTMLSEKELLHYFYIPPTDEEENNKQLVYKEAIINETQARKQFRKKVLTLNTVYNDKAQALICDVLQFERFTVNNEGNVVSFSLIVDAAKDWNNNYINPIREARISVGLSQTMASEIIGVPLRTWQSWELGTRHPAKYVEKLIIDKLNTLIE